MAKAKYTPGKDGRFQTKVWDGTYNPDGRKHSYLSIPPNPAATWRKR